MQFARDDGGDAPTAADFDALGLQLPIDGTRSNAPYLNAINDALKSTSISATHVQTPEQLQGLIIAAQHVLDAANGTPGDGSPEPTAADFLALGLAKSKIDNAGAVGVAMLADTVDASTLRALTTDENGKAIALPDKLAGLLDLIQSLIVTAAGGVANPPLDAVQLGKLGVNLAGVAHNADGTLQNWPAIFAAIAGSKKDGSDVNTLDKLQALVNDADVSQAKIRLFADDAVSATDPLTTPTVDDYHNIGLVNPVADATGLGLVGTGTAPEVSATTLNALMAAIKALTPADVDTMAELKSVAAAARAAQDKIRQYADAQTSGAVAPAGSDPMTPVAKDFADMGVSGISNFKTPTPDRSDGMPAGLFTVLSALATSAVDGKRTATADLVQGIVDSANKLLALADGRANTPANQPSLEDFRLLGADLSSLGKAAIKTD